MWQKAKDFAVTIYKLTSNGAISKDFNLRDQLRRASVSIASNIAEGDERDTNREAIRFFYMARGSSAEVSSHAHIAREIGYLSEQDFKLIEIETLEISRMLYGLIDSRREKL